MMRLEVLDQEDRVLAVHQITESLTLLGRSPGAHVHLAGKDIGALHVAIKDGDKPVIMDLGGPSKLKINGKEALEHIFSENDEAALLEIGSRRVRLARARSALKDIRTQGWAPLTDGATDASLVIRTRLWVKGQPAQVTNSKETFVIDQGVDKPAQAVWLRGKAVLAQLPAEWLKFAGRIQVGKNAIARLEDWAQPIALEKDVIYRVMAGIYTLEILVSSGSLVIGGSKFEILPKELRKPLGTSGAAVLIIFALWMLLFGKPETKVEEPYPVYARIQNIPVEKIAEPEQQAPSDLPEAGGGAGSEARENTAPSKLAQSLTGGLKSLVGNVLSQSKTTTSTVVAETGVGQAAAAGAPGPQVGKLAAVGSAAGVTGATKLGNLGIAGSGKGFSGGAGMGLGAGTGSGIGNGVGQGIGRGGFRLVEEESIVDGGLDKSVIAAVIQNNLSQIKYCYERQLVAEPDLFGKVVANWQINAKGIVEGAMVKQTTLNSSPVEQCMLAKISGWKFPQPKNGTKVTVSYPFLFKSTK